MDLQDRQGAIGKGGGLRVQLRQVLLDRLQRAAILDDALALRIEELPDELCQVGRRSKTLRQRQQEELLETRELDAAGRDRTGKMRNVGPAAGGLEEAGVQPVRRLARNLRRLHRLGGSHVADAD